MKMSPIILVVIQRHTGRIYEGGIKPFIETVIVASGSRVFTDEYDIYCRLSHGDMSIKQ
jgi:hypothetical protein